MIYKILDILVVMIIMCCIIVGGYALCNNLYKSIIIIEQHTRIIGTSCIKHNSYYIIVDAEHDYTYMIPIYTKADRIQKCK